MRDLFWRPERGPGAWTERKAREDGRRLFEQIFLGAGGSSASGGRGGGCCCGAILGLVLGATTFFALFWVGSELWGNPKPEADWPLAALGCGVVTFVLTWLAMLKK